MDGNHESMLELVVGGRRVVVDPVRNQVRVYGADGSAARETSLQVAAGSGQGEFFEIVASEAPSDEFGEF